MLFTDKNARVGSKTSMSQTYFGDYQLQKNRVTNSEENSQKPKSIPKVESEKEDMEDSWEKSSNGSRISPENKR